MTSHRRQLTTDLQSHLTNISIPYQCRKVLLSYGVWDPSLNMIEITYQNRSASKCFLTMGTTKNSKLYLYPEEAIYLMQSSLLHVSLNKYGDRKSFPLSLNEAYSLWFNQSLVKLEHLHVYQYLTRMGFILIRYQSNPIMLSDKQEHRSNITTTLTTKRKRNDSEQECIEYFPIEDENNNDVCQVK